MQESAKHPYLTFEEMKEKYPNEWVLLGNHDEDKTGLKVLGGYVLFHSPNKRDLIKGKDLLLSYPTGTWVYTGEFPKGRKFWL